ncbi:hypothetical protein [Massilia sp. TSP1-1-2]|uniref:hypothetical protein n=1 Tax=unclassified Massilia TaxID=2609279 RepID=UPI003CF87734
MNPRHIAMGAALLGAAALVAFGDRKPDSGVAEAVERKPARADATVAAVAIPRRAAPGAAADPAILRLTPRATLIGNSDEAMGPGQDVFGRRDWTPPPPPPPKQASNAAPPPPPPPMAPALPFTYLGKAASAGSWEVFLAIGEKTYIVRDKMVIDGTYRVDAIAPPTLTLTYLPLNQVQQLNIGVLD